MRIGAALPTLLLALTLNAQSPNWTQGKVVAIATRPARYRISPVEYTIQVASTEYVVEQASGMFVKSPPKEIFSLNEPVDLWKDAIPDGVD
jgi:hypothetical protein